MRVRKRDADFDISFGNNAGDYWHDVPDGPAQLVKERLNLWVGDWYLAPQEGTPYRTEVLGRFTEPYRDAAIRGRILGTEGVQSITSYSSATARNGRALSAQVGIQTAYGAQTVSIGSTTADVRLAR